MVSLRRARTSVLFLLCSLLLVSCGKKEEKRIDLVTFPLRGEVVGIDTARLVLTLAHEEIPNYMNAMVMPFKVKDPALLQGLTIGDSVGATLAVSRTESWLEGLRVLRHGEKVEAVPADEILSKSRFREGEPLPGDVFVNQDGKPVRFSDFTGRAIALTFIYTRCPLPDFCIRMSEHFRQLQQALNRDAALSGKWHLVSVSFDPVYDRPSILKEYGETYEADFSTWDFVTDPDTSGRMLRRYAEGFGLSYLPEEGLITHNLRTAILDKDGKLAEVIMGNEWSVEEVEGKIKRLVTE